VREERVAGRFGPAALRAVALFLVLGGLALPALRGRVLQAPRRVVLLDLSRSMTLPVTPGEASGPSRLDSARAVVAALDPDRVYGFGTESVPLPLDSLDAVVASAARSRVGPALEAAKLGGADSVWIVTDGMWTDRTAALATASGLGLGVRELRVAPMALRAGVASVRAPQRARAGDTVRVVAELRASGGAPEDSLTVDLELDGAVLARTRVPRPSAGRSLAAELTFVPLDPREESEWRRYEVVLGPGEDPLGVSDRAAAWIEISESATGAVLVSTVPDWEARFLLPALDRLVLGGARGFLRVSADQYLDMSARPRIVDGSLVQRAMRGARLLVVQTTPTDMPSWLTRALRSHPRVLVLPRGPGSIPGPDVRLTGPVPGEWYAAGPIPASPAAALLSDVDLDPLPPMGELYAVDPPGTWTVLNATRNRRGETRPLLVAGERDEVRWVVATGADWWRWAARGGSARRVYDEILSGVVGWLVEDATSQLVGLTGIPGPRMPLEWRVRADAHRVAIRVTEESGAQVFEGEWAEPPERITGPRLPEGRYSATVTAQGPEGSFESVRPVEITADAREMLPGVPADVAAIAPVVQKRPAGEARMPRPIWPFVLAVSLLCLEWVWRHRIGLR